MKIFLHYPSEEIWNARTVYDYLNSLDLAVWFDKESLSAGDEWKRELTDAIRQVDIVVALTAPQTLTKSGVLQQEIKMIIDKAAEMPIGEVFFINLRVCPVALPAELSRWQWIDMFEADWKRLLLRAIEKKFYQRGLNPPSTFLAEQKNLQSRRSKFEALDLETDYCDFSAIYPTYFGVGTYWEYVNCRIKNLVLEDFFSNKQLLKFAYHDRKLQWDLQVSEYFLHDELLSMEIIWHTDGGGAHPNHGIRTLNFFGDEIGPFSLSQLLSYSSSGLDFIRRFCRNSIILQLSARGDGSEADISFFEDQDDPWRPYEAFVFNREGVKFNFSPYVLLPYAYGNFQVSMPWNMFLDHFPNEYKGTAFFSFVEKNLS